MFSLFLLLVIWFLSGFVAIAYKLTHNGKSGFWSTFAMLPILGVLWLKDKFR
jgi:hypothetical protein